MKLTAIIGGVAITLVVMAGVIVFCVAGSVFILRYVLPGLVLLALIKLLFNFVFKGLLPA